ncbi:hypothetical protein [Peribacillus cavernae]|uniref:hypothetical protein n=1 Tax=Peribacillus cavernae TaxID=1674310 RepID=UPI00163CD62F|nr:hypothetical protein [Peribacillus cavernae]MDQ0219803.1 hypothetical protein [Peribacillus cavernae]
MEKFKVKYSLDYLGGKPELITMEVASKNGAQLVGLVDGIETKFIIMEELIPEFRTFQR